MFVWGIVLVLIDFVCGFGFFFGGWGLDVIGFFLGEEGWDVFLCGEDGWFLFVNKNKI